MASKERRSPLFWVVVATLVTALTCTILAAILYSQWWRLALYFWYAIPSKTFIHLPHEPAAIYAGTIYAPWVVATGSLATVFASVKQTSLYQMAVRWFRWKPWATIVFFAFTPIPFDPVRVLAPSSNYPFGKYVSANVTGRVFLYYLLAAGGGWLPISTTYLILIGGCIAFPRSWALHGEHTKPNFDEGCRESI